MTPSLTSLFRKRNLVSVRRANIDGYGIQGFLVGVSDELLALEYVCDFQVDGLMILRRADITEIRRTATDQFQESLLKTEGIGPGSQLIESPAMGSWRTLFEQFSRQHQYMIVERETGPAPEFVIGRLLRTTAMHIELQAFSGTGCWTSKPHRLKYSHMTCVQVNTRYVNCYRRHFELSAA